MKWLVYFKHIKNLVSRKQAKLDSVNLLEAYPADCNTRQPWGVPYLLTNAQSIEVFPQSSMGFA